MSHVKNKMDIYFDNRGSSIVINIDEYRNGYRDIKRRGGKIRLLVGRDGEVQAETEKLLRNWETMEIHGLQTALQTKLLVIVVDNALSLAIELKKDENGRRFVRRYRTSHIF
jgi:hypothetical protein